ncbi:MAG: hypothetical protein ACR2FN_06790 [Chitinophagaceae bacterium]
MNLKNQRKKLAFICTLFSLLFFVINSLKAQYTWNSDSAFKSGSANSGRIWGYAFGDYYYKSHADTLSRGGNNQYTGIPQGRNAFQFRRIYLGYDYNISKKFSAELLLAAEDNFPAGNPPSSTTASGDELANNKLSFYIKLANIRAKNIWKGTDLVVGQVSTPAFPLLSEKVWSYRSVERTITDIRRTPSYDFGAALQGVFDPKTKNFGYNLMAGNGSSAKPEADNFKWFYGDVYGYFFDKKLVIDFYADYERLNWVPSWHHSRQMIKGFIAYTTPALTIGVEGFINNLKNDDYALRKDSATDILSVHASGVSAYIEGNIVPNKLRFFARYDTYNPNNKIDNNTYIAYKGNTSSYNDPVTKEQFITAGLDFMPAKNVHFMPNVWYNKYINQGPSPKYNSYDLVYRATFYFVFGK